ncbi:hypothetical protein KFE98_14600 [bacterium SCSIO 12741]|nr:hypothetical protein KFE98_14600 [bacterium SCSIO 12741]
MQDYIGFAEKNGVTLLNEGPCQFCGAQTTRGVHECLDIFNLGFQSIDFSQVQNHKYRFWIVDAHTLQHPEIHGRWNNHFHLTRLHLQFHLGVNWSYALSPKLSDHLNVYKQQHKDEQLTPPPCLHRGSITTTDILRVSEDAETCKTAIEKWAREVYQAWNEHHAVVEFIAKGFLERHPELR